MKCEIVIDPECQERVVIYARESSQLVERIRQLAEENSEALLGYDNGRITKLDPFDIICVTVIDGKVYALCDKTRYQLKERLYLLEERLPGNFVKINQSCLANIEKMERFDTSISGTLKIRFKNGYIDYVSRRQLKTIKERIGI